MKLKEFIVDEGFFSDFKKGFQSTANAPSTKSKPEVQTKASPFDIIPKNEAKNILANIINGKSLDQRQMSLIKSVYNKI